jgi:Immunity protein 21
MPKTRKPALLDAAGRAQARQTIAAFVKIAHTFPPEALRDQESVELAKQLMASGDPADQDFLLEQVRAAPNGQVGGKLALILVGMTGPYMATFDPKQAARPEILGGLAPLLANPEPWDDLWRAATTAIFLADPEHAIDKLRVFLRSPTAADPRALGRVEVMVGAALSLQKSRTTFELALRASQLPTALGAPTFAGYSNNLAIVVGTLRQPKKEKELAHLLELDLQPALIERVFWMVVCNDAMTRLVATQRKRILPAIEAVAARLRDDPAGLARLQAVDKALELNGGLLSPKPLKVPKAPKAPPRIKLKFVGASEGGPMLALPKEAVATWNGVCDPKTGKPPPSSASGDFTGTDYGRACEVSWGPLKSPWGGFGFLKVGSHSGLVVGRGVSSAQLKDGSTLLVMAEPDEELEENVAAALKAEPKWQELKGELELPSGALAIFDSASEHAKTNNKSSLKVQPGTYRVQEYHSDDKDSSLWLFRLSPVER